MSIEKLDNGLISSVYGVEPEGVVAIAVAKPGREGSMSIEGDISNAALVEVQPLVHETLFPEEFDLSEDEVPEGTSDVLAILKAITPATSDDYDVTHEALFTQSQVIKIVENVIDEVLKNN